MWKVIEVCIFFALEISRRMGYEYVHLEGDSLMVINAITMEEQGSAHIHLLLDQIAEIVQYFAYFSCSFVCRYENIVAHMIARCDTSNAHEKVCKQPFRPSLLSLVDPNL